MDAPKTQTSSHRGSSKRARDSRQAAGSAQEVSPAPCFAASQAIAGTPVPALCEPPDHNAANLTECCDHHISELSRRPPPEHYSEMPRLSDVLFKGTVTLLAGGSLLAGVAVSASMLQRVAFHRQVRGWWAPGGDSGSGGDGARGPLLLVRLPTLLCRHTPCMCLLIYHCRARRWREKPRDSSSGGLAHATHV